MSRDKSYASHHIDYTTSSEFRVMRTMKEIKSDGKRISDGEKNGETL